MSTVLSSVYYYVLSSYPSLAGRRPFRSSVADDPVSPPDDHRRDSSFHDEYVASSGANREGGDGEGVVSSCLEEAESTLAECASSLLGFERRERFLGERIARYRMLMGRRGDIIRELESEVSSTTFPPDGGDDDDGDDLENSRFDDYARRDRLGALRTRHSADEEGMRCVVELHKGIVAEMETLRRRMDDLVEKRDDIVKMVEECGDFLIEAANYDDAMRREELGSDRDVGN
jgi:hypothetical protein